MTDEYTNPRLEAMLEESKVRTFTSGATRDADTDKPDYEGFLSPLVIHRFGEYMHKHRRQIDGSFRPSDNWQRGIPLNAYLKSLWRHFLDLWLHHRGLSTIAREAVEESLCAIIFNAQGYLHECLKRSISAQKFPKDWQC